MSEFFSIHTGCSSHQHITFRQITLPCETQSATTAQLSHCYDGLNSAYKPWVCIFNQIWGIFCPMHSLLAVTCPLAAIKWYGAIFTPTVEPSLHHEHRTPTAPLLAEHHSKSRRSLSDQWICGICDVSCKVNVASLSSEYWLVQMEDRYIKSAVQCPVCRLL